MGLELARMFVKIRGDSTMLPEDFNQAKALAESNMREISGVMAGFFYKVRQGVQSFLEKGIAGATSYEQTVTEFETLIGSAKETEATLQRLTSFAVKTPFEMPQLLGVSRGLLNAGERGEKMMGTLKMLGDVSQGNAEKFGTLGFVFQKVRGTTKLMTEEFRQLTDRGLLSLQDIAKYYGTTDQAANEMLRNGKIGFEDFRKILEKTTAAGGKNHNAMERQSTTLGGLNSTLSDAINITARLLAEPLMPYLKALTTVQIKVVEGFSKIVQTMGPAASGMALGAKAAASLGLAITGVGIAAQFLGVSVSAAWKSIAIGTGIGVVLIAAGAALGAIVMWIAEAVRKTEGWKEVLVSISAAWDIVLEAASIVGAALMEVWESVFGASLTESIQQAATYIAGLIKSIADWVISVKSIIISVAEGIAFFFRNVSNLVQLSLVESVLAVMEYIPQIEGIYQELAISFASLWSGAAAFFKAWVSNIAGGFTELKNLASAVWEAIKAGFNAAFDPNVSVADAMKDAFIKTLAEQKDAAAALNPFTEWQKAAAETREEMEKGFAEDGGAKAGLEKRRKDLLAAIAADEEARSRTGKAEEEAAKTEDEKKPDPTKAPPKVDAGRYGFEAFGDKFQDAVLKAGQGNEQKQMVGLLEHGNKTQDALLVEAKKKKGGLAP